MPVAPAVAGFTRKMAILPLVPACCARDPGPMNRTTMTTTGVLRAVGGFLRRQEYLWDRYLNPLWPDEPMHWVPTRAGWQLRGDVAPPLDAYRD